MIELKDSGVVFDPVEHKYWLGEKELKGVTSTLVERAFPYDEEYGHIDKRVVRAAAQVGTSIHEKIEAYETKDEFDDIPELLSYIRIKEEHHLAHVASEYTVTDYERYASRIDHVLMGEDGIVLVDIKTTYKRNYEKTACQLSVYKRLFERQNPGLKVAKIAMIWLRNDLSEYRELKPWADEALDGLFEADKEGVRYDIVKTYGDLPALFAKFEDAVRQVRATKKDATEKEKEILRMFYDVMYDKGVKKFSGETLSMTLVLPTETTTFDTKAFKEDYPELYERYCVKTQKAGSVRITEKK